MVFEVGYVGNLLGHIEPVWQGCGCWILVPVAKLRRIFALMLYAIAIKMAVDLLA